MKKTGLFKIIDRFGLNRIGRWFNTRHHNTIVLMYHSIVPDSCNSVGSDWLHVKTSDFRQQMQFLSENFNVISLSDSRYFVQLEKSKRPTAVVTFDDGYANNYSEAFPILREMNIPATVFLVTDTIDKDYSFWWDKVRIGNPNLSEESLQFYIEILKKSTPLNEIEKMLDSIILTESNRDIFRTLRYQEIKEMADSGLITFGSHTHNHEILTEIGNQESASTMMKSLSKIKSTPGGIPFLCPPNGDFNQTHVNQAEFVGYEAIVSTKKGFYDPIKNSYIIPRIGIGRDCSIERFKYLTGALALRGVCQ